MPKTIRDSFFLFHQRMVTLFAIIVIQHIMFYGTLGLLLLGKLDLVSVGVMALMSFFISLMILTVMTMIAGPFASNELSMSAVIALPLMCIILVVLAIRMPEDEKIFDHRCQWKMYFKSILGKELYMIKLKRGNNIDVIHQYANRPMYATFDKKEYAIALLKYQT